MKIVALTLLCSFILFSNESDWNSDGSWGVEDHVKEEGLNTLFEKAKIENRANRVYDDKVYKYITGDHLVQNNTIELATVRLNDNLQNEDVKVNMYVENLDVEGNAYRDGLEIRRNRYKNFVNNDPRYLGKSDELLDEEIDPAYDRHEEQDPDEKKEEVLTSVRSESSRYTKVEDEDISEIEEIDLRYMKDIKEVNVLIEDMRILVD